LGWTPTFVASGQPHRDGIEMQLMSTGGVGPIVGVTDGAGVVGDGVGLAVVTVGLGDGLADTLGDGVGVRLGDGVGVRW
jgi:hypothetical protein